MCMHPWFFSMGRLHLGHALLLASSQFMFSDSALRGRETEGTDVEGEEFKCEKQNTRARGQSANQQPVHVLRLRTERERVQTGVEHMHRREAENASTAICQLSSSYSQSPY